MITILAVDDRDSGLHLLQSIFSNISHISLIGLASNGQEAVAMVRRYHPDIVVMDIKMPIMDGIEATKIINQQFDQTKVVLFTGYDDRHIRCKAIQAGANAFVNKNHLESLNQVISLVVRGYEYFQFEQIPNSFNESLTNLI